MAYVLAATWRAKPGEGGDGVAKDDCGPLHTENRGLTHTVGVCHHSQAGC